MVPTLYFAYGSNLCTQQFTERCPDSKFLGPARLPDHRFFITARGYASVAVAPGSTVLGMLCALTAADEANLDKKEGVRLGSYRRATLRVEIPDGASVDALVYIDNTTAEGKPKSGYLEKILSGARHHGFSEDYQTEIARWADASGSGPSE